MSSFEFGSRVVHVVVSGHTDAGRRRSENQDHFLIADLSPSVPGEGFLVNPDGTGSCRAENGEFLLGPRGALLVVADGMGGAAAGRLASKLGVGWIYEELMNHWSTERLTTPERFAARLQDAVEQTNSRIHEQAEYNPEYNGMGTTATVVGVLDDFLYLAQVGDSRAYLVRRGAATQLTKDQSLVQEMIDAGAMTAEEAENSGRANVILQALGPEPRVRVDITYQKVHDDDVVIVCSDGLFRVVGDHEIGETVERTRDLAALCVELVDLANARGGPDNVTVLAARLVGVGLGEARDDEVVGHRPYRPAGS
ncbi:MAG TPA: protein phosphatase 2C domain-containing protein [Longimicrobiaceae bacterium]|nr:protein phosphatase 2C domain-containing protein [Longimicrobiaceae bacterium]